MALRTVCGTASGADLTAWNLPSRFVKGAWLKKGCTERISKSLHWTHSKTWDFKHCCIEPIAKHGGFWELLHWILKRCCVENTAKHGIVKDYGTENTAKRGIWNIIALKNTAKHGILVSHCTENSHSNENAIKRRIFVFMVWNLWQCVVFFKGFAFKTHPRVGCVRGVALRLRQNVGSVSCGPKIQSDGFVLWCKISVTVREFFGINSRKITVSVSVFNCFRINTVIICCFTVGKEFMLHSYRRIASESSCRDSNH